MSIAYYTDYCHRASRSKGFWDGQDPQDVNIQLAKLALIHSEVSEAVEAVRQSDPEKNNVAEELADICIRVFDLAEALEIELESAIAEKLRANIARPRMHGKKA